MNPLLEVKDVCLLTIAYPGNGCPSHISFSSYARRVSGCRGSFWLWKVHFAESDLRAFTCGKWNHSYKWKATEQGQRPVLLHMSQKDHTSEMAQHLPQCSLDWKYKANSQKTIFPM